MAYYGLVKIANYGSEIKKYYVEILKYVFIHALNRNETTRINGFLRMIKTQKLKNYLIKIIFF